MATVEIPKPRELRDYEYLERRRSWSEPDWERYTSNAQTSANGKQLVLRTRRSGRSRSQSRSRSPPAYDNDHERRYYRGRSDSSRASRSNERYARNERQVDLIESKHVNGVWYPGQSKDLTVHSSLDIKEDLEPDIGQFYCLYKIGSFTEARSYFDENLAGHFDKPLVFVMYAEMLFRQGSYHEICDLDAHIMTRFTQDAPKQLHGRILKGFWDLINSMSRHLTMRPNDALDQMIDDVACDLENHITDDERKCIGSVEIAMISLLHQIRNGRRSAVPFLYNYSRGMNGYPLQEIYRQLLRQGRVWDMCSLLEYDVLDQVSIEVTERGFPENIIKLREDWTLLGPQDTPTTLALLDYTMGKLLPCLGKEHSETNLELDKALEYATSLATSLAQKDPRQMKSRGYVRWIIAKAHSIATQDPTVLSHRESLESSPGVVFDGILPRYIPLGSENPGWQRPEPHTQVTNALNLAVNTARDTEDYQTEALALRFLISITNHPQPEFEELCELEYDIQGAVDFHLDRLVSSYLWSTSDESKSVLKENLAAQIFDPNVKRSLSPSRAWPANMLFHALEKVGPRAEKAIAAADDCVDDLTDDYVEKIESKIPDFHQQVNRRKALRRGQDNFDNIDEEQRKLDKEKTLMDTKQEELNARRRDVDAERKQAENSIQSPNELRVILPPDFSDRKKIKLSIENMDNAEENKEVTYQREVPDQSSPHTQGHKPASQRKKPQAVLLTLRKDDTGFESHDIDYYCSCSSSDVDELESKAQTHPMPTAIRRKPRIQQDKSIDVLQLEKSQSSKEAAVSPSERLPHSGVTSLSHVESIPNPPSEQSPPIRSAHGEMRTYTHETNCPGGSNKDQIIVLENMPPDEDQSSHPTLPERQSSDTNNMQTHIGGADAEKDRKSPESHQVDVSRVKPSLNREPSIKPLSRKSTMPTVEDDDDQNDIYI